MPLFFLKIFVLSLCLSAFPAHAARQLTISERRADLQQLAGLILEDYGPLQLKRELFGLDLDALTRKYDLRLQREGSNEDFSYELAKFVAEFRDSHFNVRVPTDHETFLGFSVDWIGGKVLIEDIDRSLLPEADFPFARGDELVGIDGLAVSEAVASLMPYIGMGYEPTARRYAVFSLTHRRARSLPALTGMARLEIRRRGGSESIRLTLPWRSKGKPYAVGEQKPALRALAARQLFPTGRADACSEKSRIAPPAGAEIVANVPFTAFTFPSAKGRIGFMRIPHYYPTDGAGNEVAELRFRQYEEVIRRFEKETTGLIIDQDYNCGGSILFVNKLLTLFAPEPFLPASFSFRTSETQIGGLSRHLNKFTPATDGYDKFKTVIDEIIDSRARGLQMTPKIPLWSVMEVKVSVPGGDRIAPNPIRYTKPVVLLINEMSGSGGDLFPAMMQDLKLAFVFGHRTMGAGGHLWDDPHLVLRHSRLEVNLTRSLIYRRNGEAVENAGVRPEAGYEITEEDFLGGYQNYLQAATHQLQSLL